MKISVEPDAVTAQPHIIWDHIDGPLMLWAGRMHWLTVWEVICLRCGLMTAQCISKRRFGRRINSADANK